eukprot:11192148-Lingulodinium_polyedra.AAC.1
MGCVSGRARCCTLHACNTPLARAIVQMWALVRRGDTVVSPAVHAGLRLCLAAEGRRGWPDRGGGRLSGSPCCAC